MMRQLFSARHTVVFVSCAPTTSRSSSAAHRTIARKGRRSLVVDIHCHVQTPAAARLIEPVFSPDRDPLFKFSSEKTREVNRKQVETVREMITSTERRLAEMDKMGIDVQAISVAPPQYCYWTEPELGREITRAVNDNIASIVAAHPDRFVGLGHLPMQAPQLALAELDRCAKSLGMRGVELCTNVNGKDLAEKEFAPVFARLEELGMVVFLHPGGFTQGERLSEHYLNNVIGNPLESTIAVSHLIFGGVLDRHPKLKVVVAHGGGYLGSYPFRMDHAWRARPDCRVNIKRKPTDYLRRLYFDTIVFDPRALGHLVDLWGADHILLGTDYPYDMGDYDPLGAIKAVKKLKAAERDAIAGGNAARLLGIKPRAVRKR